MTSEIDLLQKASTIAEQLVELLDSDPVFQAVWAKHAPADVWEKLDFNKRDMLKNIFDATAADSREEMAELINNGYRAIIRTADIMAAAVVRHEPLLDARINDYFVAMKMNPLFGEDYSKVFADAGAPTLAKLSRKANQPKKKRSHKKSTPGKNPRKGF